MNSLTEPGAEIRPDAATRDMLARPGVAAAFAAIAANAETGRVDIVLDLVNCTPANLMVLADRLLCRAGETLDEAPPSVARRTAACRIRAARTALGAVAETPGDG